MFRSVRVFHAYARIEYLLASECVRSGEVCRAWIRIWKTHSGKCSWKEKQRQRKAPHSFLLLLVDLWQKSGGVVVERWLCRRRYLNPLGHAALQFLLEVLARHVPLPVGCPAVQHLRHYHQAWVRLLLGDLVLHPESWKRWHGGSVFCWHRAVTGSRNVR